jgi:hypothetical protein
MQGNGILHPSAIFVMVTAKDLRHHIDPEAWQSVIPELKRVVGPVGFCLHHRAQSVQSVDTPGGASVPFDKDACPLKEHVSGGSIVFLVRFRRSTLTASRSA